jgi:hypothetical protein
LRERCKEHQNGKETAVLNFHGLAAQVVCKREDYKPDKRLGKSPDLYPAFCILE